MGRLTVEQGEARTPQPPLASGDDANILYANEAPGTSLIAIDCSAAGRSLIEIVAGDGFKYAFTATETPGTTPSASATAGAGMMHAAPAGRTVTAVDPDYPWLQIILDSDVDLRVCRR